MKLKAVVHETCPQRLISALQSADFRQRILDEVLRPHLRVGDFGPAEFYIQHCDLACGSDPMCEVRLTGVSVNENRATADYERALVRLEAIYQAAVETHLPKGERCQLFVSMMLDRPPLGRQTSLLERDPIYIPREKRL